MIIQLGKKFRTKKSFKHNICRWSNWKLCSSFVISNNSLVPSFDARSSPESPSHTSSAMMDLNEPAYNLSAAVESQTARDWVRLVKINGGRRQL